MMRRVQGGKGTLSKSVERTVEKNNEGEKTPLESSDREGAEEAEGCRCELHDSAENNAPPRLARIQTA